jgi:hypothetical protein
MSSKDDAASRPEGDRTANRRWLIGISVTLVFGLFGAVMALLSYMDRNPSKASDRPGTSAPSAPSSDPAPGKPDKGQGKDKK